MGVSKKILKTFVGDKIEEQKLKLKSDKVNKEVNIEKEKTKQAEAMKDANLEIAKAKREAQAHDLKMEEAEAENFKDVEVNYALASSSIDYLIECINKIEELRFTYKYKNMKRESTKDSPQNNNIWAQMFTGQSTEEQIKNYDPLDTRIVQLINNYKIPMKKTDFLYAFDIAIASCLNESESISNAWRYKISLFKKAANSRFPKDKEVESFLLEHGLKVSAKRKAGFIIGFSSLGLVVTAGIVGLVVWFNSPAYVSLDKVPDPLPGQTVFVEYSASHFDGNNYVNVKTYFESVGFEDITLYPMGDLITGWINKADTVDSVSINGKTNFSKGWYYPTDKVIISYHSFK